MARGSLGLVLLALLWGCSPGDQPTPTPDDQAPLGPSHSGDDSGEGGDSGTPGDGGDGDDGGTDSGTPAYPPEGPWPNVPQKNYSADYAIPSVQSIGVDEAYNLWLLSGNAIGVLRPGDTQPHWTYGVGQAATGFGASQLATGSTVICGGSAGRAYVGYSTYELPDSFLGDIANPEYRKGDMDLVKLNADGTISLVTHLQKSAVYLGGAQNKLGIRNTNDWRYDEDRSVLVCNRLMTGPNKGDVFIGTNHGVTMIRGSVYNSHRHPVWDVNGSLRIGYSYALGFSFDSTQVLIGNEWKIAILPAPADLVNWDNFPRNPWVLDTWVAPLNSLEEMDFWRGFTQTKDGSFYLASEKFGLWKMVLDGNNRPAFSAVPGLPTSSLGWVQGTTDGSLFVATHGAGLWRMAPDGALARMGNVPGSEVKQLVFDPSVTPAMLYVLTNSGLTVLRGY